VVKDARPAAVRGTLLLRERGELINDCSREEFPGDGRDGRHRAGRDRHRVLVHGRTKSKVEAVVAQISESGGIAEGFVADLSSLEAVRRLGEEVRDRCEVLQADSAKKPTHRVP
jgi:hypothetical protein